MLPISPRPLTSTQTPGEKPRLLDHSSLRLHDCVRLFDRGIGEQREIFVVSDRVAGRLDRGRIRAGTNRADKHPGDGRKSPPHEYKMME